MRIEKISPRDIIPLEAPHRRRTVESLCAVYEDPNLAKEVDRLIPYVFVHFENVLAYTWLMVIIEQESLICLTKE